MMPIPNVTPGKLQDRALKVHAELRMPRFRVTDRAVTAATNSTHGIAAEMGSYSKRLIAPAAIERIAKLHGQFRNWNLSMTLPWEDGSYRLLPTPFFTAHSAKAREFIGQIETAVAEFLPQYPQYRADASNLLGRAFDPTEYPAAHVLPSLFAARVTYADLADPNDYRLPSGLSPQDADAIRADALAAAQDSLRIANLAIVKRLLEPVSHMARKLREYDAAQDPKHDGKQVRFHDSLVDNVEAILTIIPALNITNDPTINALAKQCVTSLMKHSADDLRDDAEARAETADAAETLSKQMAQFF